MNGRELEKLLSLLDNASRDEVVRFVSEHREEVLKQLRDEGKATISVSGGKQIVLRPAA